MKSKTLIKILFLFASVMLSVSLSAQNVADNGGVRSYRKISADSTRLKSGEVKGKNPAVTAKGGDAKKRKKPVAPKEKSVDSLEYSVKTYRLGERVIMPGDSGRDVRSVAKILVNKIYISEEELIYTADGGVVYKGGLVRAVKHFQEFNGFYPDGIIGQDLIKALRKRK